MRAQQFFRYAACAAPAIKSSFSRRIALTSVVAFAAVAPAAQAAPPVPCGGVAQITDAKGDGHHNNTDVVAAWLTESGGRLQAVVQVNYGLWEPAHEDSVSAGFALLYELGGQMRYVRAAVFRGVAPVYDFGTWTVAGGFVKAGDTAGTVTTGPNGSVTIDVPAVAAATVVKQPFVLTYDGIEGTDAHWVDRAPGGVTPDGTEFGADFTAGACTAGTPGLPGTPGTPEAPGTNTGSSGITAIALTAPRKLTGGGRAKITGRLTPARSGITVEVTATTKRSVVRRVTTGADGSFSLSLPLSETAV